MPGNNVKIAIETLESAAKSGDRQFIDEKNIQRLDALLRFAKTLRSALNKTLEDRTGAEKTRAMTPNLGKTPMEPVKEGAVEPDDVRTRIIQRPNGKPGSSNDRQNRNISKVQKFNLFHTLEARFERTPKHYKRPKGIKFHEVKSALEKTPALIYSLFMMEKTGGAPDIIAVDDNTYTFADCSAESPTGRRNCVYDKEAEKYATRYQKKGNAVEKAEDFGVDNMMEDIYRDTLQKIGEFDLKTFSWLKSFDDKDSVSSAPIGSRRDGKVRVVQHFSHYSGDNVGWRGVLRVPKVSK